ncbi:hypothetical protein RclHR1_00120034 [Rhizophagus clarus]|uniref:Ribonuclease H-like domain-containing protein n=1 Tax=Rhizophagus clarus TaxID=94130 RepID=A0A2Z6Q5Z4_9GLOM|nr:hypothetical protein RclHR1_00120034 [Rhizophagus clarus]GES93491.1 ribonuclease H-like domain-containing protein [Rhizophagus clarus]
MGFAWIEISSNSIHTPFQGAMAFQPSSTKAETYAILSALITAPSNAMVTINTDSQNVITNYHQFKDPNFSLWKHLKVDTYMFWTLIFKLITSKNPYISIKKIKAHYGNQWNDVADALLKSATNLLPIFLSPANNPNSLLIPTFNHLGPLDSNLRKWTQRTCHAWISVSSLHNHSFKHILNLIHDYPVNWIVTSSWLR